MATVAPNSIDALRRKALADWRAWAHALAKGGKSPNARELVDTAAILGRDAADLEDDAAYLRAYAAEVAIRDRWKAGLDAIEAERGDLDEITAAIEQAEADLDALRKRLGWGALEGYQWGAARSKCERLRKQRPDLFEAEA